MRARLEFAEKRSRLNGCSHFAAIIGPLVIGAELDLSVILLPLGIPLDLGGLGLWGFCAYDAYRTAKNRMRPAA